MMYEGNDLRKHERIAGQFVILYRIPEENYRADICQTKDISLGGLNFTASRQFDEGAHIVLEIRLFSEQKGVIIKGKVKKSREIAKGLIYDTRLEFLNLDDMQKEAIGQVEKILLGNKQKNNP
ncbi:MAG: PilZ domain-containing protein [Candidatus Omnitrophica bacterium]|jgi:hypothetical protein|nr:PilZ domain-containing protein [Candidatus Omnitrophota bacterium]